MISTIIVTRSRACSVKTLHLIMNINMACIKNRKQNEINFVNDDPFEIADMITKKIHERERIIFVDYGVGMSDIAGTEHLVKDFENDQNCVVMPAVTEGIDWSKVKDNIVRKSKEPVEQAGMNFDTEIGDHIKDCLYKVKSTIPRLYAIDCKKTVEQLKNRKKATIFIPPKRNEMFEKFLEKGLNIYAYTKAKVFLSYQYESIGKINQAYGLTKTES